MPQRKHTVSDERLSGVRERDSQRRLFEEVVILEI